MREALQVCPAPEVGESFSNVDFNERQRETLLNGVMVQRAQPVEGDSQSRLPQVETLSSITKSDDETETSKTSSVSTEEIVVKGLGDDDTESPKASFVETVEKGLGDDETETPKTSGVSTENIVAIGLGNNERETPRTSLVSTEEFEAKSFGDEETATPKTSFISTEDIVTEGLDDEERATPNTSFISSEDIVAKGLSASTVSNCSTDEDKFVEEDGALPLKLLVSLPSHSAPLSGSLRTDDMAHESLQPVATRSEPESIADDVGSRPMTPLTLQGKKGGCSCCGKGHLLRDKEFCMACGAKYCSDCLLSAMGSMPEGRKCVGCLGQPIHEMRRPYIGKPSRLLKNMLSLLEVQQIMKAERECPANQLRPDQVVVNNMKLSAEELTTLVSCSRPPLKLKPGKYWYDGQTGLWGKEGHRPDKIVSPHLKIGGNLHPNSSNGRTNVFMNGRELGKLELKMLKFAGVKCPPDTHLWVESDGSYREEGFNNVKGNIWGKEGHLWEKASIKLLYPFLSLPTLGSDVRGGNGGANQQSLRFPDLSVQTNVHKLLLLGHESSGRSTIFKQAKILYTDGFTKEEISNFRDLIQNNIFKYLAILLEGRERFEEEEDDLAENSVHMQQINSSILSFGDTTNLSTLSAGMFNWNEDKKKQKATAKQDNIYRLDIDVKQLSDWLMENMPGGNLESAISHTSHAEEYAVKIEQLWLSSAIQATFSRKSELPFIPDIANYFLNRVVEVCRSDYEPTESDILRTEGLSEGSGLVQVEISLEDKVPYLGSWQDTEQLVGIDRYQVIRVGGKGMSDRHKWLDMFEDVRAVVFCVALSDYDLLWIEKSGTSSNKMIQTRDLFESILRHPCFQDTPFALLLNKYDVFEEKIHQGVPLTSCTWFSDFRPVGTSHYTAQNQAQQAYQYIAHKYKELFNSVNCTGRKLFTFQLNALDKTTVSGAFQYVRDILKWEDHKASGWGMLPEDHSYSTDISSFSQHSIVRQPDVVRREHY